MSDTTTNENNSEDFQKPSKEHIEMWKKRQDDGGGVFDSYENVTGLVGLQKLLISETLKEIQ